MPFLTRISEFFKLFFILELLGTICTEIKVLSQVCVSYIFNGSNVQQTEEVMAEVKSMFYIYPELRELNISQQFSLFHEHSIAQGIPLGSVLISTREFCRFCDRNQQRESFEVCV